ncbi:MAG TPA: Crp/Fnr family transcriptional regulator [Gaiellaceae bacterium]|jgi:CRP-like cAMP-binding protein
MRWSLLDGLPEEDVRALLAIARRRVFRRGEVVFHRDDPADSLHLVQKGRFAVRIMTPLGETATVAVRGPGDSFGEMAVVDESARRAATVAALEDAETFAVYQGEFHRLRARHPQIDRLLIGFLTAEVRRLDELLLEALYVPVERRVLRRLVELAGTYAGRDGEIPLTQEQLAELAGTSRATVNKVLRDEQRRGTVELRRGRTIVVQPDELARRGR